ncbi:trypsin-like peptidase domain-containing protein [Candidatus Collierbacteria bacterium]|nr:trypsin-like peptidase domain-containing protein [Candidatus Collierbacteria bacterium]
MKKFFVGFAIGVLVVVSVVGGALADRLYNLPFISKFVSGRVGSPEKILEQKVLNEESVVVDIAEKSSPSVVTVSITAERQAAQPFFNDPFGLFGFNTSPGKKEQIKQDIGTGFVIDSGLVVTNKHVVASTGGKYRVITKDDKEFQVNKIYRDPTNDIAILKVDGMSAPAVRLGDSGNLKVGQFVIAIGTALGEFRHTVTTGVISGLGRGIQAGDPFGGNAEQLDNVIQTDAAINPGNSGGPLLNSLGEVIGINVAVAQGSQNIGFALPINSVKEVVDSFQKTGQFERPFLGVRYRMISQKTALLNDVPQGAYVEDVIPDSPADKGGILSGDIITKIGGSKIDGKDDSGLAKEIAKRKVGETVEMEIWREGEIKNLKVILQQTEQ